MTPVPSPEATIDWTQPPSCRNWPQDVAAWRLFVERHLDEVDVARQVRGYLWRGQAFTSIFHEISPELLLQRLQTPDTATPAAVITRELTVLWLNLVSGRLNRATGLEVATDPNFQTVADVVRALEQALAVGDLSPQLLDLSQQLQRGELISQHVCARLIYRAGSTIRESIWTQAGYIEQDQPLSEVPPGFTSFSPDFTWLAIETPWNDAGGGPIFLFNLRDGLLLNLNQELSLPTYGGPLGLSISGWHPKGDHLLLSDEDDDVVVWTDVSGETQQWITLNPDAEEFTPIRQIELAPDGERFIYVVDGPEGQTIVNEYELATQTSRTLATLPVGRGRLKAFRFSPVGDTAAYVQSEGRRTTGRSYALELFNLKSYTVTTLIEANLGQTEPVWSPDGQKIAFVRKSLDEPDIAGVELGQNWEGNIWVAFLDTGDIRQMTFVTGAVQRPVWSLDSRLLAFITGDGELGLVSLEQPGVIWRLGTTIPHPQFTTISFVP